MKSFELIKRHLRQTWLVILASISLVLLPKSALAEEELGWCEYASDFFEDAEGDKNVRCLPQSIEFCKNEYEGFESAISYFKSIRVEQSQFAPVCLIVNAGNLSPKYMYLYWFSIADLLKVIEGKEADAAVERARRQFLDRIHDASTDWMGEDRLTLYLAYYANFIDREWRRSELHSVNEAAGHPAFVDVYCFVQNDLPWQSVIDVRSRGDFAACIEENSLR